MNEIHTFKNNNWSNLKKFLTLLFIFYLIFSIFPFPLNIFPIFDVIVSFYTKIIDFFMIWFGKNILGIDNLQRIQNTGSGDTTLDYVKLLWDLIASVFITILVLLIYKKRSNFNKLYYWTITYARYYLGMYLIFYGLIKLFEGQFQSAGLGRLEENFGDASPMGLLWTFMGYSKIYGSFTGFAEALAGFLILFHKTKTLGALISIAVMSNVVLLNFCFDVPVKLFSSQLLIISFIILGPNVKKLYNFFILNKSEMLNNNNIVFSNKKRDTIRVVLKLCFIILFTGFICFNGINYMYEYGSLAPKKPLVGCYNLTNFYNLKNDSLIKNVPDSLQWKKFVIGKQGLTIFDCKDNTKYFTTKIDTLKKTIQLKSDLDTNKVYFMKYLEQKPKKIILTGLFEGKNLKIIATKKTIEEYKLNATKFHWIQEYPNNQ